MYSIVKPTSKVFGPYIIIYKMDATDAINEKDVHYVDFHFLDQTRKKKINWYYQLFFYPSIC